LKSDVERRRPGCTSWWVTCREDGSGEGHTVAYVHVDAIGREEDVADGDVEVGTEREHPGGPVEQTVSTQVDRPWRVASAAMSAVVIILLAACSPGEGRSAASSSSAPSPTIQDYPIVWLDTPNLDLDSPDGTFVRGIAESWYLRSQLGLEAFFPGYRQASVSAYVWSDELWPRHDPPHTTSMWVAPFPDPDPQNDPDWHPLSAQVGGVAVCVTSPGTHLADGGLFFTYSRGGRTPPENQRGPRQAPIRDIYGDWKGLDFIGPTELRAKRCDNPPSTLPIRHTSTPGWPSESD
jgi:hypothetical protein